MITGLGYAFGGQGLSRSFISTVVKWLHRLSLSNAYTVIFQNCDNKRSFIEFGLVDLKKAVVVNGSGVNLITVYQLLWLPNHISPFDDSKVI